MNTNLTDEEKGFLIMLLRIGAEIVKSQDYLYFGGEPFSAGELYGLCEKLGFQYWEDIV